MNASERINLKKEILGALASKGWPEIDLTLGEFGLQTWSDWDGGGPDGYILASVREADDATLHALAVHLGVGVDPASAPSVGMPGFWAPQHFRLFITHQSKDKKKAAALSDALRSYYISGFVAHNDIQPTEEWEKEIQSALRTMDALLALFSPGILESKYADQEIGFALGRSVLVVPVCIDGAIPHGFVQKHQGLIVPNGMAVADVAEKVFHLLRGKELTKGRMADAVVSLFENSNSYATARENIGYLEEVDSLDEQQLKRVRDASKANSQIRHNTMYPQRVNALLSKHGFSGPKLANVTASSKPDEDIPF